METIDVMVLILESHKGMSQLLSKNQRESESKKDGGRERERE